MKVKLMILLLFNLLLFTVGKINIGAPITFSTSWSTIKLLFFNIAIELLDFSLLLLMRLSPF